MRTEASTTPEDPEGIPKGKGGRVPTRCDRRQGEMKMKQRFKLGAGAGLVTMLLGALMVLAPVGAGAASVQPILNPGGNDNPSCSDLGYDVEVKHNVQTNAGAGNGQLSTTTTVAGITYEFVVNWTFHPDKTISFNVVTDADANVDLLVSAAIVKQAAAPAGGGANVYAYSPPVASDTGLVDPTGDGQFSHLTFCADIPAPSGSLSVDKDLAGNNQPAASTQFTFTVACTSGEQAVALSAGDASFTLTAAQTKTISNLPVGATCTVTETGTASATSTTYKIGEGATTNGTQASGATIAAGATTPVLFTNTYTTTPPPTPPSFTYSVDVDKRNDADNDDDFGNFEFADAEGDDIEFQISIENTGSGNLTLAALTDTFDGEVVDLLTDVDLSCLRSGLSVTLAVGSVLPAGSTTVCTFTLDDYAPAAGSSLQNVVAVDTAETGPASDTSTVAVPEVLPDATGTVTLVKEVTGDAVTDWEFDFTGALGEVSLTNEASESDVTPVLAGDHTIAEDISDLPEGWELAGATCVDQDDTVVSEPAVDGSVDFEVAPNADVTCTFVNEYTAPPVPAVVPAAEVKGDVVTRPQSLPRTGDETRGLAGMGAFMLALGAAMVLGSRRQLARR
jgi:LPXTG-motif cell wall-anchored protein